MRILPVLTALLLLAGGWYLLTDAAPSTGLTPGNGNETVDVPGTGDTAEEPGQNGNEQEQRDTGPVGALNHELLQSTPYTTIVVEIDYVTGHAPTQAAKNRIAEVFSDVAGKDVTFTGGNTVPGGQDTYTVNDLETLQEQHRTHYTENSTAAIHFLLLDSAFEEESALGVAYQASAAALFPEQMQKATTATVLYPEIERAVAVHELGHLFGLVNINYQSSRDHADPDHPQHSANKESVMYWAVEDLALRNVFNLGPPHRFDEDDRHDLQQIKAGNY